MGPELRDEKTTNPKAAQTATENQNEKGLLSREAGHILKRMLPVMMP